MFHAIRQRFADMHTIKLLCEGAERHANADGQQAPGSEHFILAALELPDGSARRAFTRAGADPERFRDAIAAQYENALAGVGINPGSLDHLQESVEPGYGPFQAHPSAQTLMQELPKLKSSATEPLLGAHVVAVGASARRGVAPRALRAMGIDSEALVSAAHAEISAFVSR